MRSEVHHTRPRQDNSVDEVGLLMSHEVLSTTSPEQTMESWIIDSGVTCHISNDRQLFSKVMPLNKPKDVILGDKRVLGA